jgi:hypothetical protein
LAAGFIGIDAVIAAGVLGFGRNVVNEAGDGADAAVGEAEPDAEGIAESVGGGLKEKAEEVAVPRLREKMPRRARGIVKTNWRWGTLWQTEVAIQAEMWRTRRWWLAGQRWRPLQVKARRCSSPQSGQRRRKKPEARSPQRRKFWTMAKALARSGPMAARWTFS